MSRNNTAYIYAMLVVNILLLPASALGQDSAYTTAKKLLPIYSLLFDDSDLDSDGDGISDVIEIGNGSSPDNPCDPNTNDGRCDTDTDGLINSAELDIGSDPENTDSDNDGITDFDEVSIHGTSPLKKDTDLDGLEDLDEINGSGASLITSDPLLADTDADGLSDSQELSRGTDLRNEDSDADGVSDGVEVTGNTNPLLIDTDADGLSDGEEVDNGTDPLLEDTDSDGLTDKVEVDDGTNPTQADEDDDGLNDLEEKNAGTNPSNPDSDSDGVNDGEEINGLTNPLLADTDQDGLIDGQEIIHHGTNPLEDDSDFDGFDDMFEISSEGFDPLVPESLRDVDGDTISNADEIAAGTYILDDDSDNDGVDDGQESLLGTDPLDTDSDNDGVPDGVEVQLASNPLSNDSDLDTLLDGQESLGLDDTDRDGLANIVDIDSDGDGLNDINETNPFADFDGDDLSNMLDPDSDNDGINDGYEAQNGLNHLLASDALLDMDGDGLTNVAEIQQALLLELPLSADSLPSFKDADYDDDGIDDGKEKQYGLSFVDPADAALDKDEDGLANVYEIVTIGTDPLNSDTDGDQIDDKFEDENRIFYQVVNAGQSNEFTNEIPFLDPLDPLDALEDPDGDRQSTLLELQRGTDPNYPTNFSDGIASIDEYQTLIDSDGDGLTDIEELYTAFGFLPSDPDSVDTDGDGINDFLESNISLPEFHYCGQAQESGGLVNGDVDNDGLPDSIECILNTVPFEKDSDYDGLEDGEEVTLCVVDPVSCPMGYLRHSDPILPDSDLDGLGDAVDPQPLNPDTDGDGLTDGLELAEGFNLVSIAFDSTDGQAYIPVTQVLPVPDSMGFYRLMARVEALTTGNSTFLGLSAAGHSIEESGIHTLLGPVKASAGSGTEELITLSGNNVRVLSLHLVDVPNEPGGTNLRTFVDHADSDLDGLSDREEYRFGIWLEAEHYSNAPVVQDGDAFNGQSVSNLDTSTTIQIDSRVDQGFTFGTDAAFNPGQTWSVYVRAKRANPGNNVSANVTLVNSDDASNQQTNLAINNITPHYRWIFAGNIVLNYEELALQIATAQAANTVLFDRILLAPFAFTGQSLSIDTSTLAAQDELLGVNGTVALSKNLPWGLTDPMQPDTDKDGQRLNSSALPSSTGRLLDGQERALGLNPFSADSDGDAALVIPDQYASIIWDGAMVMGTGTADGIQDYIDSTDPSPLTLVTDTRLTDQDNDGLVDSLEDINRNGVHDIGESDFIDNDTDSDGIPDGVELGVPAGPAYNPTDPLNADTDRDGVDDGIEDANKNGVLDAGESDPNNPDTDGDGLFDGIELMLGTDPTLIDSDSDGLSDAREDFNRDGVIDTNEQETDPKVDDTDGDGLLDGEEVDGLHASNPVTSDSDRDGISDFDEINATGVLADCVWEFVCGTEGDCLSNTGNCQFPPTNPLLEDSDHDGLSDLQEVTGRTITVAGNPVVVNTPGGAISLIKTNPMRFDTDGDLLIDTSEINGAPPLLGLVTSPVHPDTDGDEVADRDEVIAGTDPQTVGGLFGVMELTPGGIHIEINGFVPDSAGNLMKSGKARIFAPTETSINNTGPAPVFKKSYGRELAQIDGDIALTRSGNRYQIVANGELWVQRTGLNVPQTLLWTGPIEFSNDLSSVTPGTGSVENAAFEISYGEMTIPPLSINSFELVSSELSLTSASFSLPSNQTQVPSDRERFQGSGIVYNLAENVIRMTGITRAVVDTSTACGNNITSETLLELEGDMELTLPKRKYNGPQATGVPSRPYRMPLGQAPQLSGSAQMSMPNISASPMMPSASGIDADIAIKNQWKLSPSADFNFDLGAFDIGSIGNLLAFAGTQAGVCVHETNLPGAATERFRCPFSFTRSANQRKGRKEVNVTGNVSIYPSGLAPFQVDPSLFTFENLTVNGVPVADQIDLCQNGQVDVTGRAIVVIPSKPYDVVIDGTSLIDVTTADSDELFVGSRGTLSLKPKTIQTDEYEDYEVPLRLVLGDAVGAVIFDQTNGTKPEYVAFEAREGFRIVGPGIASTSLTYIEPFTWVQRMFTSRALGQKPFANGVIDLSTGVMQGNMVVYPFIGQTLRLGFEFTPPVDVNGDFDINSGGFVGSGTLAMKVPNYLGTSVPGNNTSFNVSGGFEFDGPFSFSGQGQADLSIPGLVDMPPIQSPTVTITHQSIGLTGEMNLGIGSLSINGSFNPFNRSISFTGTGDLNILGFPFANVTAEFDQSGIYRNGTRLSDRSSMALSGEISVPLGVNGAFTPVSVSGTYASPTDFLLTGSIDSLAGLPVAGTNARITIKPSGVTISSFANIPFVGKFLFTGEVQSNGAFSFTGSPSCWHSNGQKICAVSSVAGVVSMRDIGITFNKSASDLTPTLIAHADVHIGGSATQGFNFPVGRIDVALGLNGSFDFRTSTQFFGNNISLNVTHSNGNATVKGNVFLGLSVPTWPKRFSLGAHLYVDIGTGGGRVYVTVARFGTVAVNSSGQFRVSFSLPYPKVTPPFVEFKSVGFNIDI